MTIRLPLRVKEAIEAAAQQDRRDVSTFAALVLERETMKPQPKGGRPAAQRK